MKETVKINLLIHITRILECWQISSKIYFVILGILTIVRLNINIPYTYIENAGRIETYATILAVVTILKIKDMLKRMNEISDANTPILITILIMITLIWPLLLPLVGLIILKLNYINAVAFLIYSIIPMLIWKPYNVYFQTLNEEIENEIKKYHKKYPGFQNIAADKTKD